MEPQKFSHKKQDYTADNFSDADFNRFDQHSTNNTRQRFNQSSYSFSRRQNFANGRANTWTAYNNPSNNPYVFHRTRKRKSRSPTRSRSQHPQSQGSRPPKSRRNRAPKSRGSRPLQSRGSRPQSRGKRPQSRATSPLYGSEEYTQRKVQETSELIKQQLLNGEDKGLSALDIQLPHKDDVVKHVENDTDTSSIVIISDHSVKKPNTSVPKLNKNRNVKEIHDKIVNYLTHLTFNKMTNLVNLESTVYDTAIHQIQKQKRLEFSRALRDVCLNKESRSAEAINSLIPDFDIKIETLPAEIIQELRSTLNIDQEDLEASWNYSDNAESVTCENVSGDIHNRSESPDVEMIEVKPECIVIDETSFDGSSHKNMKCKDSPTTETFVIKREPFNEISELCASDQVLAKKSCTSSETESNSNCYDINGIINEKNKQPDQEVEKNCDTNKLKLSTILNIDQEDVERSWNLSDNVELKENAASYENISGEICNRPKSPDVEMIEVKPECIEVVDETSYNDDVSHQTMKCQDNPTENIDVIKKEPFEEVPEFCASEPELERRKSINQCEHEVEKMELSATLTIDQDQEDLEGSRIYNNVELKENATTSKNISGEVGNRSESPDLEMIEVKPECIVVDETSCNDVSHQNIKCQDITTENIDVIKKEPFEEIPELCASDPEFESKTCIQFDCNSDSYEIINQTSKQPEHAVEKNNCETEKLKCLENSEKSDDNLSNLPVTDVGLISLIGCDVATSKPSMVTSPPSLSENEETIHNGKRLHSTEKFVSVYTQTDFSPYNQSPKTLDEALKTMFEIDSEIQKLTLIRQQLFSNLGRNEIDNDSQTEKSDDTAVPKETPKEISTDEPVAVKKRKLNLINSPKSDHPENSVSVEPARPTFRFELKEISDKVLTICTVKEKIAVGTDNGKVIFFSLLTGDLLSSVKVVPAPVTCINFYNHKNDRVTIKVFIGSVYNGLKVLGYNTTKFEKSINFDAIPMCLEKAWDQLFIGCRQGCFFRYSLKNGKIMYSDKLSQNDILVLSATHEGCRKVLLVGSRQCPVTIRDAMSGLHMRTLENVVSPTVYSLVLTKGIVFCGTVAHDLLAFSFYSGVLEDKFAVGNAKGISVLKVFNDVLFASCHDGNIYVYNTQPRHFIGHINGPGGVILAMELIPTKIIVSTMRCKFVALDIPSYVMKYCLKQ